MAAGKTVYNDLNRRETAAMRVGRRSRRRRRNDNRFMIALVIIAAAAFCIVLIIQIRHSSVQLDELKEQETRLEAEYNEQLKLAEELKDKEKYVKTNAYIEEQARKYGLVYPDEIIFKPED